MSSQTGTYLETARHVYGDRESIDQIPLERAWMIPTVVLHTPGGPRHKVTLDEARRSLDAQDATIEPGDCVLLHTGWDREWRNPGRYLTEFPYVSRDVVYWLMDQRIGIWGATRRAPTRQTTFRASFPDFFKTDILLLAPVVNLDQVQSARPKPRLCALPLPIDPPPWRRRRRACRHRAAPRHRPGQRRPQRLKPGMGAATGSARSGRALERLAGGGVEQVQALCVE